MTAQHAAAAVDLLLTGGRITTLAQQGEGSAEVQSLAIAGGRVLAVGSDDELAPYASHARRVIELGGRRVIPGLIDSHIHAVRGGVSWLVSVHWDGVRSIADALEVPPAIACIKAGRPAAYVGEKESISAIAQLSA